MAVIAEWLVKTLSAAAPSIHFIVNFWIYHRIWSHLWTTWLHFSLDFATLFQLFLSILEVLDIEVDCFILERHISISWLYHPVFPRYCFEFAYEAFMYGDQSSHV